MLDSSHVPSGPAGPSELAGFHALAGAAPAARLPLEQDLVLAHMDLADSIARRYLRSFGDPSDIRQVALLGLVKSVRRFDPNRGSPFAAFARATISGEIKRYLRDHGWAVRPPRSVQEVAIAVAAASPRLEQSLGHHPSRDELAAHLGIDEAKVAEGLVGSKAMFAGPIDEVTGGHGSIPRVADPSDGIVSRSDLRDAVRTLSCRDQTIVYLRYVKGYTQREIAEQVGTSQVQVSRTLTRVLCAMRKRLGEPYGTVPEADVI